eukprot:6485451-Amphidinium_carterae.1
MVWTLAASASGPGGANCTAGTCCDNVVASLQPSTSNSAKAIASKQQARAASLTTIEASTAFYLECF